MNKFKIYSLLMISAFILMSVNGLAVNNLIQGSCGNGRTWWANIEINNDGSVGCITGMNCNGQGYQRNCGGSGGGGGSVTTITSSLSGSDLTVTLSATSNLKVYQVVSGNLVYTHSSTISSGVPTAVSTSSWGTGPFIIVTFDPSTNEVTGSLQISLN